MYRFVEPNIYARLLYSCGGRKKLTQAPYFGSVELAIIEDVSSSSATRKESAPSDVDFNRIAALPIIGRLVFGHIIGVIPISKDSCFQMFNGTQVQIITVFELMFKIQQSLDLQLINVRILKTF